MNVAQTRFYLCRSFLALSAAFDLKLPVCNNLLIRSQKNNNIAGGRGSGSNGKHIHKYPPVIRVILIKRYLEAIFNDAVCGEI